MLIARLHDDSPSVVSAVLDLKLNILKVLNKQELVDELIKLVKKTIGDEEWYVVILVASNRHVRKGCRKYC